MLRILLFMCLSSMGFYLQAQSQEDSNQQKIEREAFLKDLELLPPPAIKISDIPAYNNYFNANPYVKKVSLTTTRKEAIPTKNKSIFTAPDFNKIKKENAKKSVLNLSMAKRIATNELFPTLSDVYFVQLASLSKSRGNFSMFNKLTDYGNIYKIYQSGRTKIKLGYYMDEYEAKRILNAVKSRGFSDAFVTKDRLNTNELELVLSSYDNAYDTPSVTTSTYDAGAYTTSVSKSVTYKVRLASYEDPIWFDIEKARTLGTIEQWTKGNWTIFILSEFQTYESAKMAMNRAIEKGFVDSEIVMDNNGVLERIK